MLDGPGILKYAGFGLSRLEDEDLDVVFKQFSDTGETWASTDEKVSKPRFEGQPKNFKNKGIKSIYRHDQFPQSIIYKFQCCLNLFC